MKNAIKFFATEKGPPKIVRPTLILFPPRSKMGIYNNQPLPCPSDMNDLNPLSAT